MSASDSARLFTPGPLNTRLDVRRAMLRDIGSRQSEFIDIIRGIRRTLLEIAGAGEDCTVVPMQGSGTFAIEAAIGTLIPRGGKLLVLSNGEYGRRAGVIAERLGIPTGHLHFPETLPLDPALVAEHLEKHPEITHVAAVHCETTTGILNPIAEMAAFVAASGRHLLVDAMSSFGGIDTDMARWNADAIVFSANKCLESVPGIAFVLTKVGVLQRSAGNARSTSMDLTAQWAELEASGQFRFTPPTHACLALAVALEALKVEGGIRGRHARYTQNQNALTNGMLKIGFFPVLRPEYRSPIISAFHHPADQRFNFDGFQEALAARGLVIYPGKLASIRSFRIGTIGQIGPADFAELLLAIHDWLNAKGIAVPLAE